MLFPYICFVFLSFFLFSFLFLIHFETSMHITLPKFGIRRDCSSGTNMSFINHHLWSNYSNPGVASLW
jgi:hypothetical protein